MKILVIPSPDITFYNLFIGGKGWPKLVPRKFKWYFNFDQVSYEYPYYSDLVNVENTFVDIIGDIHKAYLEPPNEFSTNPSGSNCPAVSGIKFASAWEKIKEYDAFLISSRTSKKLTQSVYNRKSRTSKVAIIEHEDHDDLIKSAKDNELYRGFSKGRHFDLYFKKDIPIDVKRENLFPMAPDPIRAESFPAHIEIPMRLRTNSVFFSGIVNKKTTHEHRSVLLQELSKIPDSKIIRIGIDDHYAKNIDANSILFAELQNSKFVICAPGRSWTTTRISMAAFFGCVPILCEPDIQTVGLNLVDGENCILYPNVRYASDKFRKKVAQELIERISTLSDDTHRLSKMAAQFKEMYLCDHSTYERAKYIKSVLMDSLR